MEIIETDRGTYVIRALSGELGEGAWEALRPEQIRGLVSWAIGKSAEHTPLVIELYRGAGELVIFARPDTERRTYFAFDDFETVAAACADCKNPGPSALYRLDGRFVLELSGAEKELLHFGEFGELISRGRLYGMFLKEHGQTVISEDAVNFVKNTF